MVDKDCPGGPPEVYDFSGNHAVFAGGFDYRVILVPY